MATILVSIEPALESLMTESSGVILSAWQRRCSSMVGAFSWTLTYDTKIFSLCSHSHMFIHLLVSFFKSCSFMATCLWVWRFCHLRSLTSHKVYKWVHHSTLCLIERHLPHYYFSKPLQNEAAERLLPFLSTHILSCSICKPSLEFLLFHQLVIRDCWYDDHSEVSERSWCTVVKVMESGLQTTASCFRSPVLLMLEVRAHLMTNCYRAHTTLWLEGAMQTQLLIGSSRDLFMWCLVVRHSISTNSMPEVGFIFQAYNSPCARIS